MYCRFLILGVLSFGLLFGSGGWCQSFSDADWPTRAGDMQRQGRRDFELGLDGGRLHLQWKRFLGERVEVEMEPVVVGGTVFLGLMNCKLVALERDTGALRWIFRAEDAITDTPTVSLEGGAPRILFGTISGMLYCLDAGIGDLLWSERLDGPICSTPAVADGVVLVGTMGGGFYGLELAEGAALRRRWRVGVGAPVSCTAAVGELGAGGTGVYFSSGDNVAWALKAADGSLLWKRQMEGAYTKRTYAVHGRGSGGKPVLMLVTRKAGREYSEHLENLPEALQNATPPEGPKPGPTVVSEWADYYQQWPRRRPLYFFHAETGEDLWQPEVDDTLYAPLFIPYWGAYMPVVDGSGRAWFPASGSGGDHALGHDERLWSVDLETGLIAQRAGAMDFKPRGDETGRPTLLGDRYYQTISEDVAYYDTGDGSLNAGVFGNGMFTHRQPIEIDEFVAGERSVVFGGWHKFFTRFGSSSPGGFGGANDAQSALVAVDDGSRQMAFFTAWGHLYALADTEPPGGARAHDLDRLDLYKGPWDPGHDVAYYRAELERRLDAVVAGHDLEATSRFWGMNPQAGTVLHAGESIAILAQALEQVEDAGVAERLERFLVDALTTHVLSASHTQGSAWLDWDGGGVTRVGDPGGIAIQYRQDNPNRIAMKLYALYRVAKATEGLGVSGWDLVEGHWDFIRDELYGRMRGAGGGGFDAGVGFYVWPGWVSNLAAGVGYDNFHPTRQMGMALAMREMAERVGDTATREEAAERLAAMLGNRLRWATYTRGLYATGDLSRNEYGNWRDWGYEQSRVPVPAQGYLDADTEYRVPYGLEPDGTVRYALTRHGTYPYYLVHFWPFIPEFAARDRHDAALMDLLADYTGAIERMHAWWFMGDFSHIVGIGMHEDDSMSHGLAVDLFEAKARLEGWEFERLRPYLPWEYEAWGELDIYRVRALTALLWAAENNGGSEVESRAWEALQ